MRIPFEITRDDIAEVGRQLGCDFSDEAQIAALTRLDSVDVQAAPGSGKTTLLVAKLAIISRRWSSRTQGVCVLSHTNVARHEVETRLAHQPTGRLLLAHPHFIGTFQAFAHQFLALPYLRGLGLEPRIIDDNRFAAAALRAHKSWHVQNHLNKHPGAAEVLLSTLRYEGPDLEVRCRGQLPGAGTDTYKGFADLKNALAADGYFRFEDMFAYACRALREVPGLAQIVRQRFPCVFIDEMQDTDRLQEHFLQQAFGDAVVLQRFGDQNQAIFSEGGDADAIHTFPKVGHIDLARSRRFGGHIAGAASTLTLNAPQIIQGDGARPERRHSIFLYGDEQAQAVIPAFGDLVLEEYAAGFPKDFVVKAIAGRKAGDGKTLPRHLGDYWAGFDATHANRHASLSRLVDFVRRARGHLADHRDCHHAVQALWDGILALAHRGGVKVDGQRALSRRALLVALAALDPGVAQALRHLVRELCFDPGALRQDLWAARAQDIALCLDPLMPHGRSAGFTEFLTWSDGPADALAGASSRPNVIVHRREDRAVDIHLATIHGVKGETHHATLVLATTTSQVVDLKEAIGPLKGTPDQVRMAKPVASKQLRILFVGMTRPSDLLCLALPAKHVDAASRAALQGRGWRIVKLAGAV